MAKPNLQAQPALIDLCRRWQIAELAVFGSVARGSNRVDSDLDLLVTFAPDAPWDALDIVELRTELAGFFGQAVDLVEEKAIRNPYRRASILRDKSVLYAA
jgi:predicted nucleotidyltransferase